MKIKTIVLATILLLGSVITSLALVSPGAANATGADNDNRQQVVNKTLTYQLECSNAGGQQDVAKVVLVTNTTGKTLPKGHKLLWKSTDGDKGVIELDKPLKPGEIAVGQGRPGQNYQCTATTPIF